MIQEKDAKSMKGKGDRTPRTGGELPWTEAEAEAGQPCNGKNAEDANTAA